MLRRRTSLRARPGLSAATTWWTSFQMFSCFVKNGSEVFEGGHLYQLDPIAEDLQFCRRCEFSLCRFVVISLAVVVIFLLCDFSCCRCDFSCCRCDFS
ncbi:hypothetical protein JOB18_014891 [Solea senegalensis]|uniref:Secreted protein n=1 Tax=Solea senegalensis TaxID=28829 RepID=A0AAV6Q3V3_SOLSE|nr:hypothetical protein JOB18_014891 [Solea senegalensis]